LFTDALILIVLVLVSPARAEEKIVKETLTTGGRERSYYLFVPERAAGKPSPLIVTLHGSGRDGRILVEHWRDLARKEGIVLAGPDALDRQGWHNATEGPQFLYDLVEALKETLTVDPRRVYLFGHSAGAIHAMHMGILESEYFAAVAAHAGVVQTEMLPFMKQAPRKIPIGMWVGTDDRLFPLAPVRATRDGLAAFGFPVELSEIKNHTHDYYRRSSEINKAAFAFLQQHKLDADPKYQEYLIGK
jgi:poly(3-hydroxybutyrate) depolymerase